MFAQLSLAVLFQVRMIRASVVLGPGLLLLGGGLSGCQPASPPVAPAENAQPSAPNNQPPAASVESTTPDADAATPAATAAEDAEPAVDQATEADPSAGEPTAVTVVADVPTTTAAGGPTTNRLAQETSPYLRMHMHNPVDWYPWGPEAFAKAKQEGKLIFLSVGYSSCYWCHVMERESFMDPEIAAFMNQHFVCIKVDREERPDVDAIYMMAVQLISQRGGWPMSVFMTPDARPFFGGTYFPARDNDRPGATGFLTLLQRIHDLWASQQAQIETTATKLTEAIQANMSGEAVAADQALDPAMVDEVKAALAASFDDTYGGFGFSAEDPERPKFPEASRLWFLLDCVERTQDAECLRMLKVTLDRMAMGGIWDHVGGGFHRYSVDRFWHIPHFEKMLYDNGQLLSVYSRAYHLTRDEAYRDVVAATVSFLLREMRDPGGAFVSALDAESEKVEGQFYRWSRAEVQQVLGADEPLYATVYGLAGPPNFEGEFYVPLRDKSWEQLAEQQSVTVADLVSRLQPLNDKLLSARAQRVRPLTDVKILCSWNGLTIRGLADAGRLCERPEYTQAAAQAATFILEKLRGEDGRLRRTYSEGAAKLTAYLDDYAFFVDGLIALHQATGDAQWLQHADALTQQQLELYWDDRSGGFFFTAKDHEALIVRSKQLTDEAQPAGNSVAAGNLVYLSRQLDRPDYRERAEQTVRNLLPLAARYVAVAPRMTSVLADLKAE